MLGHELKQLDTELKELNEKADQVQSELGQLLMTTDMYRDLCKMHLAAMIHELRGDGKESEAKLENMARANEAYKKNFVAASRGYKKSQALRLELDRLNDKIDSWRTRISLRKTEIERFGG